MRHTPRYLMTDPDEVKRLIRGNPWATFISPAGGGLVASWPRTIPCCEDHQQHGVAGRP